MNGGPAAMRDYARRLHDVRDELCRAQLRAIEAAIPEFHRPGTAELAHAAAGAILDSFAALLEHGRLSDVATPTAVRAFVRCLAWAGVDADVVGRAYRIGQEKLYEDIRRYCADTAGSGGDTVALLGELGQLALRYSDVATTLVLQDFRDECRELARHPLARRAEIARSVLDRRPVDLEAVERALGYRLAGTHTAFVVWADDRLTGADARLAGVAATLVELVGAASLVVQDEAERLVVWLAGDTDAAREAFAARVRREPGVRAAVGNPGVGVEGFRRTRLQAARAGAVGPRGGESLVRYADVSLVAMLLEDRAAACAFVDEELGDLAADDEVSEALRGTLRVFLEQQCRHLPAARAAHLHRNTVAERIRRIEALLDRDVPGRATELLVALRLHDHVGHRGDGGGDPHRCEDRDGR